MLQVEPLIKNEYVAAGEVRLAFNPMLDHGEPSRISAHAAECAGAQSPLAFWQMHDALFSRQSELWQATDETMVSFANALGLDGEAMRACLADPAIADKIVRLDQARRDEGVRLRPTFDLNSKRLQGAIPYEAFAQEIDQALAQ